MCDYWKRRKVWKAKPWATQPSSICSVRLGVLQGLRSRRPVKLFSQCIYVYWSAQESSSVSGTVKPQVWTKITPFLNCCASRSIHSLATTFSGIQFKGVNTWNGALIWSLRQFAVNWIHDKIFVGHEDKADSVFCFFCALWDSNFCSKSIKPNLRAWLSVWVSYLRSTGVSEGNPKTSLVSFEPILKFGLLIPRTACEVADYRICLIEKRPQRPSSYVPTFPCALSLLASAKTNFSYVECLAPGFLICMYIVGAEIKNANSGELLPGMYTFWSQFYEVLDTCEVSVRFVPVNKVRSLEHQAHIPDLIRDGGRLRTT